MNLYDAVNNMTFTENGALTNKSSLNACLDLFAVGGAARNKSSNEIEQLITNAWDEDKVMTLSILFYLRDIREGGMGEKRIFREGIKLLTSKTSIPEMLNIIPEIGSWKDVFEIYSIYQIAPFIKKRFLDHIAEGKYDLMEKYMPSIGGAKNRDAEALARYMGMTPKQYRKALSKARASLKLVETSMCENRWGEIVYPHVPSKAMLNYKNAFRRHDMSRYNLYLENVNSGKEKINAKVLLPYEITHQYITQDHCYSRNYIKEEDETLELLWKNLKNYECDGDSLVIADVSGSMYGTPMDVSTSLAIYFAERNTSIFKDTYITFSGVPKFQKLDRNWSLKRKLQFMYSDENWGSNTNLQAVFDMILSAATSNKLPESEMPKTLYIISDMEFDEATGVRWAPSLKTNFDEIKSKYTAHGYTMPNIIFWNVNSRRSNMPVTKNDDGVALVSGCSPSIFEMVASNKEEMNPLEIMKHAIAPYEERAKKALINII